MNSAASVEVKGWCPGALQAMQSGDGLIVRVRPFCGALGTGAGARARRSRHAPGQRPYRPHATRQPAAARPLRGRSAGTSCGAGQARPARPRRRDRGRAQYHGRTLGGIGPRRALRRASDRARPRTGTCCRRAPARVAGQVRHADRWRRHRFDRRRTRRCRLDGRRQRRSRSESTARPERNGWASRRRMRRQQWRLPPRMPFSKCAVMRGADACATFRLMIMRM